SSRGTATSFLRSNSCRRCATNTSFTWALAAIRKTCASSADTASIWAGTSSTAACSLAAATAPTRAAARPATAPARVRPRRSGRGRLLRPSARARSALGIARSRRLAPHRRLGLRLWSGGAADRALHIGDIVRRDADQLPAGLARIVQDIDLVAPGGHVAQAALAVFPLRHPSVSTMRHARPGRRGTSPSHAATRNESPYAHQCWPAPEGPAPCNRYRPKHAAGGSPAGEPSASALLRGAFLRLRTGWL